MDSSPIRTTLGKISLRRIILASLAFSFFFMCLAGAFVRHSDVPSMDMWDGYLNFLNELEKGNFSSWWDQHNEHRIVLTKLFFWLNLRFFEGTLAPLIILNFLLVIISILLFWKIFSEMDSLLGIRDMRFAYFALSFATLFTWYQSENLIWAFQSQFYLAYLLPLAAFYYLARSYRLPKSADVAFVMATGLGIASAVTMANGVAVLPLMCLRSLALRGNFRRTLFLLLCSISVIVLYFHGYHQPEGHGQILKSFVEQPLDFLRYILLYLGVPFYFIGKFLGLGLGLAYSTGGIMILAMIHQARQELVKLESFNEGSALNLFIIYVCITAIATAGGRLVFGVEQALSSRYATPVTMAWIALLALVLKRGFLSPLIHPILLERVFIGLMVLMLPQQLRALRSNQDVPFDQILAALAVELRVKDAEQISQIYPDPDRAMKIAEPLIARNRTIFGTEPLRDMRSRMGSKLEKSRDSMENCQVWLDSVQSVPGASRYVKLSGRIHSQHLNFRSVPLVLTNQVGQVVGLGIIAGSRTSLTHLLGLGDETHRFAAYLDASLRHDANLIAHVVEFGCLSPISMSV